MGCAIEAVGSLLEEESVASVQKAALITLAQVAEHGNRRAVEAISARIGNSNPDVCSAALQALGKVAERGNANAVRLCTPLLEDNYPPVRRAAVVALGLLA